MITPWRGLEYNTTVTYIMPVVILRLCRVNVTGIKFVKESMSRPPPKKKKNNKKCRRVVPSRTYAGRTSVGVNSVVVGC